MFIVNSSVSWVYSFCSSGSDVKYLRVVDTAVILLNAVSGVEVGTEMMYQVVEEYHLPRIFFVNRMDKEHASFDKAVKMAQNQFSNSAVVVQFPVNEGESFNSIIDLIKMKMLTFESNKSGNYTENEIPDEYKYAMDSYMG